MPVIPIFRDMPACGAPLPDYSREDRRFSILAKDIDPDAARLRRAVGGTGEVTGQELVFDAAGHRPGRDRVRLCIQHRIVADSGIED
jgi:hypothetical protein